MAQLVAGKACKGATVFEVMLISSLAEDCWTLDLRDDDLSNFYVSDIFSVIM